jgi:hypothetical protein
MDGATVRGIFENIAAVTTFLPLWDQVSMQQLVQTLSKCGHCPLQKRGNSATRFRKRAEHAVHSSCLSVVCTAAHGAGSGAAASMRSSHGTD